MNNIAIIGLPRSGTSLVANLIRSGGFNPSPNVKAKFFGSSDMNLDGYFEDVEFILLNDQLMRQRHRSFSNISFLNPPEFIINEFSIENDFKYDIDEDSLDVPELYQENLSKYFSDGKDWWGLTNMYPGKKWYQAYRKFELDSAVKIRNKLTLYKNFLKNSKSPTFLKDPRLTFTLDYYGDLFQKVIWVERSNAESHLKSLKRHYGNNFLNDDHEYGFEWSINHFNYKPLPITYSEFISRYMNYKNKYELSLGARFLKVDYDDLISADNKKIVNHLENFINNDIDKDLIRK